jgi:hypothetical protein
MAVPVLGPAAATVGEVLAMGDQALMQHFHANPAVGGSQYLENPHDLDRHTRFLIVPAIPPFNLELTQTISVVSIMLCTICIKIL